RRSSELNVSRYIQITSDHVRDLRTVVTVSVQPPSTFYFDRPEIEGTSGGRVLQQTRGPLWRSGFIQKQEEPWKEPLPAEEIPKLFRRERGQFVDSKWFEIKVRPEPYEKRMLRLLLLARKNRADELAREGKHADAAALYESILRLDPWMEEEP